MTEKPSYLQTYAINSHYRWKNAKKKVFFQSKSRPLTMNSPVHFKTIHNAKSDIKGGTKKKSGLRIRQHKFTVLKMQEAKT